MPTKCRELKISTIDCGGNELASYIIDISDICKIHNLSESIFDMTFEEFEPTVEKVKGRLCPNLHAILKEILKC